MVAPVIQYPLDLTGKAATNLIAGEVHDLSALTSKAFVTNSGPFFVNGLVVRNQANGQVLTTKTQYIATQLLVDMTLRTGLDICSVIVITDTTLPSNLVVSVDYQALGGAYSGSVNAIQQLIDALNLGNMPVYWADVIGKPVLFPPTPHLHDMGDVYGFEYITAALERLVQAVYTGDAAQFQAVYDYVNHEADLINGQIATVTSALTAHLTDFNNPHQVTKTQAGLGSVDNFATASAAQGQAGTATNLFMTPASTSAAITAQAGSMLAAHIANHSNPHAVTAAQVGLGNVSNFATASTADATAGTATNLFMTPALVKTETNLLIAAALNPHLNNFSNPHQVTKAQVGLGSVNNYGTASDADGQAGTSTALYMTPSSTKAAIASQVGNTLAAHIANLGNPHQVTKAQVGLGNVNNYGTASNADGQAGTSGTLYMTPASTQSALNSGPNAALAAHIANHSNPHAVTAAQVGLGNVLNIQQVQVGTGSGQLNNAIKLGWNGSVILAQVDATPMGTLFTTYFPDPNLTSHVNNRSNPHAVTAAQVGLGSVNNTSDANKPVSGPQQAALNAKASLGSAPNFDALFIGGDQIYIYESSQGALTIRSGSGAQGYQYNTFAANGDLSVSGVMYAGNGYQPSDIRLKDHVTHGSARPLWQGLEFAHWVWKDNSPKAGKNDLGVIAQDVEQVAPEYVSVNESAEGKPLNVNYTGLALEMAMAAGKATDDNHGELAGLRHEVAELRALVSTLQSTILSMMGK